MGFSFRKKEEKENSDHLVSPWSCFSLSLNSAIGSGILGLPQSFNSSGIVLSSVLIYFFALLLYATCMQFMDMTARYWHKVRDDHEYTVPDHEIAHLGKVIYELPDTKFWRRFWYAWWQIGMIIMQFITVMIYCNISAGAMAQLVHFPMQKGDACLNVEDLSKGCGDAYMIWVTVYIAINFFMCFIDLKYQAILQNLFAVYRWVLVIVLIGLASYALKRSDIASGHEIANKYETTPAGFGALLPMLTFSLFIHSGISYLYEPVRNKDKTVSPIFLALMIVVAVIYCIVACLNALVYGNGTSSVITTNYLADKTFTTKFEKGLIQLINWYPPLALTFASSNQIFPFAESILEMFPQKYGQTYWIKMGCRWCCLIIPSVIVYGVRSFNALVSFSSFAGYIMCFNVPAGVIQTTQQYRSKSNPFNSWFWSSTWFCWTIQIWSIFSFIYTAIYF